MNDLGSDTGLTRLEVMHRMRRSGASLQEIAEKFAISREWVRRLLISHLTTAELVGVAGCRKSHLKKLRQRGVIQPARFVGRRALWSPETITTVIIYVDRWRCRVCGRPLPPNRWCYCSPACSIWANQYKNKSEELKRQHQEDVARWRASHPQQAKQIELQSQRKYRAKKSAEKYQSTEYVVWRKCFLPLGTVIRVVGFNPATGRLKVECGIVEVARGCVKRI